MLSMSNNQSLHYMYSKTTAISFIWLGLPLLFSCNHSTTIHDDKEKSASKIMGNWSLVSSQFANTTLKSPDWDGYMLINENHFSRSYVLRNQKAEVNFAPIFSNAGPYKTEGNQLQMIADFNTFTEQQGMVWKNTYSLSKDGKLLTLKGSEETSFIETWTKQKTEDLQ